MIKETCVCGAAFETDADDFESTDEARLKEWRDTHPHTFRAAAAREVKTVNANHVLVAALDKEFAEAQTRAAQQVAEAQAQIEALKVERNRYLARLDAAKVFVAPKQSLDASETMRLWQIVDGL